VDRQTAKITQAIERRTQLGETDAVRLVDGNGDGLPGLILEDYAGRWLAQTADATDTTRALIELLANRFPSRFAALYWKKLSKSERTSPDYIAGAPADEPFPINEAGLKFWIDFRAGYSQGIFLDQRISRSTLRTRAAGKTVLNTFAYTCAFGVAAAGGGATTVNLDLSRHYLEWGKRNYELNGLDPSDHEFLFGDVFDWLGRFARRNRKFDYILLDPPTFSRDRAGKVFRVQSDLGRLVTLAGKCLMPNGVLFCSTNFRGLTWKQFVTLIRDSLARPMAVEPGMMPPDFTDAPYLKSAWMTV
jgi:23S rRNA (cytosine1962-C5)-methyltransferase